MSEETIRLVQKTYEAINRVGRTGEEFVDPEEFAPALWGRIAPDFELHSRPDVPDVTVYRGPEGAKDFFRMIQETWAEIRWEVLGIEDLGHAVLVEARIAAVGRGSDIPLGADETDVFWFRDGELVRMQGFPTKSEALDAAGASAG